MAESYITLTRHLYGLPVVISKVSIAVLWLLLALWFWYWLGPMWITAMRPKSDQIVDFYQEWGSARNYGSGFPIYTRHSISIPRYLGLSPCAMPNIEYNIHPPTSVMLTVPLGRLSYPDAVLVWNVISVIALLASMAIVATVFSVSRLSILPALTLLALCHPVFANVYQGQLNLILVLLITAMWVLDRSGNASLAGLCLGIAATIKLFPAYLALYYLAQGQVRPLKVALVSFVGISIITAIALGLDSYYDYVMVVLPWNAEFRILGYNLSIAGFWHKLFYPVPGESITPLWSNLALARSATLLSTLIITASVAIVVRQARTRRQRELAFATTAIAMLLISPVTWDTSLPILLVPFATLSHSRLVAQSQALKFIVLFILLIDWAPQVMLTEMLSEDNAASTYPWYRTLGSLSLKFYALLGTFVLSLFAYRFEKVAL